MKSNQTKNSTRAIKATSKRLLQISRALQNDKQQRAIERLLDEEFTSLTQAKRELKKNTVQLKRTSKTAVKTIKSLQRLFRDAFNFTKAKLSVPNTTGKKVSKPANKVKVGPPVKLPSQGSVKYKPLKQSSVITPVKKSTTKVASGKPILSTRPLRAKTGETMIQLFDRLESMGDSPDDLLKDGERWMFTYGNGRAKRLYANFGDALSVMRAYDLSKAIANGTVDDEEFEDELVTSISFAKTNQRPMNYADKKEVEAKLRENERRQIQRKADSNVIKSGQKKTNIFQGNIGRVEKLNNLLDDPKYLRARLKELESKKDVTTKGRSKTGATSSTIKPTRNVTSTSGVGKGTKAKSASKTAAKKIATKKQSGKRSK